MTYTEQVWLNGSDGDTPLSASRLNHMEDGIGNHGHPTNTPLNGQVVTADSTQTSGAKWASIPASISPTSFTAKGGLLLGTGSGTFIQRLVGADGQVLVADSTQTDGVKWSSSGLSASLFSAKGSILVGTGSGTLAARSVGANGTVLTADSTQTDGVRWAAQDSYIPYSAIDAKGDLIAGAGPDNATRLAAGGNTQVLISNSATVTGLQWVDLPPRGVPVTVFSNKGDMVLGSGVYSEYVNLAMPGVSDYVLTSDPTQPSGAIWALPDVDNSSWTAKGDLLAGTGSGSFSRRTVGSNGQVLTADSAQATGMNWVTPTTGGVTVCTSTTKPSSPVVGAMIWMTDKFIGQQYTGTTYGWQTITKTFVATAVYSDSPTLNTTASMFYLFGGAFSPLTLPWNNWPSKFMATISGSVMSSSSDQNYWDIEVSLTAADGIDAIIFPTASMNPHGGSTSRALLSGTIIVSDTSNDQAPLHSTWNPQLSLRSPNGEFASSTYLTITIVAIPD